MAVGAGGDNLEDDNTEVNIEFIITFVIIEGLIVLGSLAAAVLHFHAAGKRLSKVAHFHLTHLAFCTWFFAFDFTYAVNEATYSIHAIHRWCSRFQFSEFIGVDLLFLVVWWQFARYWEFVLAKHQGRIRIRSVVILILGIMYIITYSQGYKDHDCANKHAFYRACEIFMPVCIGIDAARLGILCWKRVAEYSSSVYIRAWESLYFFEVAVILFVNPVMFYVVAPKLIKNGTGAAGWYLCQYFQYIIPSTIMICAMWRRNYLTISHDRRTDSTSFDYDDDGHVRTGVQIKDLHHSAEMHNVDGGVGNPLAEFA